MGKCYCCSGRDFGDCCQPFIDGTANPQTAEALMRSRFSAYSTANVEYILQTTHSSTRKYHDSNSIKKWAESNVWQKLEIISTLKGTQKDSKGTVEFKAYYLDLSLQPNIHHEHSNFVRVLGKWFFVDGTVDNSNI